jgi:HEAT repeat protein
MNADRLQQIELELRAPALNRRINALNELAKVASVDAIPILQKLFQQQDVGLRRLAVMGLGNHLTEDSFQILEQLLQQERDGNVLAEAANSIFEFGDRSIPLLHNLFLRCDDWLLRQTIISLFLETDRYEILLEILTESLQDKTQMVKETAILALGQLLESPVKERALAKLAKLAEDREWRNRWRTAIGLQASTAPQVRELIVLLQQDENFHVVAAALENNFQDDN